MQTEKKGLSRREKVLLIVMLVFGSFALMTMFVILPLYNQLNDMNTEYGYLETERMQTEVKLAAEAVARDNYTNVYNALILNSERFLNPSLSNEIGRMLTSLCERYGLQPISQQLSAPKDFVPAGAGGSGNVSGSNSGSNSSNNSGNSSGNNSGDGSVFLIVSASMAVKGTYDELKDLLDAVENIEYFRVTRVSFSRNTTDTELPLDRISLNFEVTMLKDFAGEGD